MDDSETVENLALDASKLSVQQLNDQLKKLPEKIATVKIIGCQSTDLLAPGLGQEYRVSIVGDLGDFCFWGVSKAEIEVQGNAGCGIAESMQSGSLIVHGDVGDAAGAFNRGGLLAIYGSTGRRAGVGMCGGDLLVRGSIGSQGAMGMSAGTMLVLGSAGAMLGQRMSGGTIYIRGEIESMAPHLEETRLKESDRLRIGLLFLKAGIKSEVRDLRVFKSVT
ncbi:MAG: hypothetical protein SGI77_25215 [Pirellulaceae bacterium]|nr:hypothetical protein [Pirellulaceae bacterium]